MRILPLIALSALVLLPVTPSHAQTYPWCLYDREGGVNCGFVSQQQCMASRGGNADMCMVNGLYRPSEPREKTRPARRQ